MTAYQQLATGFLTELSGQTVVYTIGNLVLLLQLLHWAG